MKLKLYLLSALSLISFNNFASHVIGGEITYSHISGNNYELRVVLYRDCSGIQAPNDVTVNANSSCTGPVNFTLQQDSSNQVNYCNGIQTSCQGGTLPGIEWYSYSDVIQLPQCSDWTISYSLCCRNPTTNLIDATTEDFTVQSELDNTVINSSPIFNQSLNYVAQLGSTVCINNNAFDPDGDSLVYEMTSSLGDVGQPIPYDSTFSYLNPFGQATNTTFNPNTGNICMTPNMQGNFVGAVRVLEYRNGVQIGATTRDFQIMVVNGIGQPSQDVIGQVTDSLGNPIPNVSVELLDYGVSQGNLNIISTQQTNLNGEFSFTGNSISQFLVRTQPSSNFLPSYHNSTAYWQYAQVIYSLCDAQVTANIELIDQYNPIGTGVISGYLNGMGVFRAGDPIEGVTILLYDSSDELIQTDITDQDGYYELSNIPAGDYYILVDTEGLVMLSTHEITIVEGEIIEQANFFAEENGVLASDDYLSTGFAFINNETKLSEYELFPNPGNETLFVQNNEGKQFDVTVFNISGRKVMEETGADYTHRLDVKRLQKGTYIVVLKSTSTTDIIKWVKN